MSTGKELARSGETVERTVLVPATKIRPEREVTVRIPAEVARTYPAVGQVEEIAELAAELFSGDANLGIADLTRIKVPSGDSKAFTIGEDPAKTFKGVIILHQPRRNFWEKSMEEGGGQQAPDCYSRDAIHGKGLYGKGSEHNPSGLCDGCPMNQWLEDEEGKRLPPPCKPQEAVLVLMEDKPFPVLLTVPRTSLKPFQEYWKRHLFMGSLRSFAQVVTEFNLVQDKSDSGVVFNRIGFKDLDDLGTEVKMVMLSLGEQYRTVLVNLDTSQDTEAAPVKPDVYQRDGGSVDDEGGVSFDDEPLDDPVGDPLANDYADA
jgi:hypothetical protein